MSAKRVLVTGAGGFIGRWSVPALLSRGYEVHALLSPRSADTAAPRELVGARLHYADLLSAAGVDEVIKAVQPTHLLHFAWIATPRLYWTSADNYRWVAASLNMLRTFHTNGGTRYVAAGTCAEYDWTRAVICYEDTTPLATDGGLIATPYATAKIAMQKLVASYGRHEGLSTAWGRIFFQYGPYEHPDRLVPSVTINLLRGTPALCSHGRQIRSFLHAADVGSAFVALLDSDVEGPVNIGSDEQHSIAELVDLIAKHIGCSDLIRLGARPAPANEPELLVPDLRRLYEELDWRPTFTLSDGVAAAINWWRVRLENAIGKH